MHNREQPAGRPVLVELMGLAGSGKSTVFDRLLEARPSFEQRPGLRRPAHLGPAARGLASVLRFLVRERAAPARAVVANLKLMAYLRALPGVVARGGGGPRTVVFDQGPVYLLMRPRLQDERLRTWWDETFDLWASLLDVVVWLDAPDDVLLERIDGRAKWHALKGAEQESARAALARTRALYASALTRLEAHVDGPTILRFETSRERPEDVAEAVVETLDAMGPDRPARSSSLERDSIVGR